MVTLEEIPHPSLIHRFSFFFYRCHFNVITFVVNFVLVVVNKVTTFGFADFLIFFNLRRFKTLNNIYI